MGKISTENMSFIGPLVRQRGFGVAAFDFAPGKRREEKMLEIPADFPLHLMAQGRKA